MIAALKIRRDRGLPAFACLSCDNLQHNGSILRRTMVELARFSEPALADWIAGNSSFPSSMVDCIVPATGQKELDLVRSFGVEDASPVTHENFRQWVIEDDFCAGRPDWDKVGATFVADVADYEKMKLRILNGGHQIIAIPGELLGIETIAGAIGNPSICRYLTKAISEEVAPSVGSVADMEPLQYLELIKGRFSNTEIHDTTRRVAFDGSSRQTGFLHPSIRDGLKAGLPVDGLALASALWRRYCEGIRENGTMIEPNDPHWSDLNSVAIAARDKPRVWLEQHQYYGDLACDDRFAEVFTRWHQAISNIGVKGAIDSYLNADSGYGPHVR